MFEQIYIEQMIQKHREEMFKEIEKYSWHEKARKKSAYCRIPLFSHFSHCKCQ